MKKFYHQDYTATVIGDAAFLTLVRESQFQEVNDKVMIAQVLPGRLGLDQIIVLVAAYYKVDTSILTTVVKGPKKGLLTRKVAMYLCQQLGGYRLADIWDAFGLSNVRSVSFITTQIRKRINETPDFAKTIQRINLYIIKQAT